MFIRLPNTLTGCRSHSFIHSADIYHIFCVSDTVPVTENRMAKHFSLIPSPVEPVFQWGRKGTQHMKYLYGYSRQVKMSTVKTTQCEGMGSDTGGSKF